MSYQDRRTEWCRLSSRALTPDDKQYFICYSSPMAAGLQIINTWSPNSADQVEQAFKFEYYHERPDVQFVLCPGSN